MRIDSDIDIDFGNREQLLSLIKHVPAAMRTPEQVRRHQSGVYITDIPVNPIDNMASIDYHEAEARGYFKIDLLNVHVYTKIKNEQMLMDLMKDPDWTLLKDSKFVNQLIHIANHYYTLDKMPEPVDSIPRLAMFLAIIRPGKKHLVGKTWKEIAETVWDRNVDGYTFKRSHAIAYAQLVVVHMNLLANSLNSSN